MPTSGQVVRMVTADPGRPKVMLELWSLFGTGGVRLCSLSS
jgi:hypothetical protein